MIPYGRHSIDEDDVAAVVEVLRGDWLTQGPHIAAFEEQFAAVTGALDAVMFSSGTAALHGAVVAAGIGPGDGVATTPLSFAASAACALYAGATPVFVDIDPVTLCMDTTRVPTDAAAVVAVHYAGYPAPLDFAARPPVVIEDAAHALGATTPDGPVGNCSRSDMCVFSLHPVKAVTSAEGGVVTTNDAQLADRLRRFRNHGMVRRPENGGWFYEIADLGFNYRMTDIQAALGTSQLTKLERFVTRRNELAARYDAALAELPVRLPPLAPPGSRHAYHLYPVRVPERRLVYERLHEAGVATQVHYVPLYRHPLYARYGKPSDFPVTESVYDGLLSLPLYPDLTDADQSHVVDALKAAL